MAVEPRVHTDPAEEISARGHHPRDRSGEDPDRDAIRRLRNELERREVPALAATVIGIDRKMLAVRAPAGQGTPWVLLAPRLESVSRERTARMEICLCLPGLRVRVPRPSEIVVRARIPGGESIRFGAGGELARALQHQMDHLEDRLPVDRVEDEPREVLPDAVFRPPPACPRLPADAPGGDGAGTHGSDAM